MRALPGIVTYVIHILKHISYDRSNVSVGRFDYVCWGEGGQHNLDVVGAGIYRFKTMSNKGGGGQKLLIFLDLINVRPLMSTYHPLG